MKLQIVIILIFCLALKISAQSALQTSEGIFSIRELERQREDALNDIELTSQLLKETSTSAKSSLNRLNLLSQQLMARKKVVSLLNEEITAIDRNIRTVSGEIDVLDKDLSKIKENYAKSMQSQQQEHRTSQYKMLMILSAENLTQSYRRMRYLREYSNWQKGEAERIVKKQAEITQRRNVLENSRNEKQHLLAQRDNENKKLETEQQEQQKEVKELSRRQKELQGQLQQKRKEANALNSQIDKLIAEDIANSKNNAPAQVEETAAPETAAKAEETATKTEEAAAKTTETAKPSTTGPASSNYILTESEATISKNFASNKGKHPYPLTGKFTIISRFGEHQHQELSHVRTNNNGIDIQTTAGAEARAIYKGVITRVFVMPGFNNNVIIRHGDYLTVYSNLSEVYVKAGDAVDTSQSIGKIFTDTEKGNETILQFQIWHERNKLNPTVWIR